MYIKLCILLYITLVTFLCIVTVTNMDLKVKTLSIADEDFIDNCDYFETDHDLDHTLFSDDDLNIVQLNVRGLFGKQQTLIQENASKNPNKK